MQSVTMFNHKNLCLSKVNFTAAYRIKTILNKNI